jgi:hypothetical protein
LSTSFQRDRFGLNLFKSLLGLKLAFRRSRFVCITSSLWDGSAAPQLFASVTRSVSQKASHSAQVPSSLVESMICSAIRWQSSAPDHVRDSDTGRSLPTESPGMGFNGFAIDSSR